jgi:hypothetical protein
MLHDRCPGCGAPVVFFRSELGRGHRCRTGSMVSCWQCGFDLRRAPAVGPDGPDGQVLMALRSIDTFYDLGWWFQGEQTVHYGHLYFDVLHHLVKLLPTRCGLPLLRLVERKTGWASGILDEHTLIVFERRPVHERHGLLLAALWLLNQWPHRFVQAGIETGATQSGILSGLSLPYWFESEIRVKFGCNRVSATVDEAVAAAAYLVKRDQTVSKAAVGRLIGSKDCKASDVFARREIATVCDADLEAMIAATDRICRQLSATSSRCHLLRRDKTILQLQQLLHWPPSKILGLSLKDGIALATTPKSERARSGSVAGVVLNYLRHVRSAWPNKPKSEHLFLSQSGGPYTSNAWRVHRIRFLRLAGHSCARGPIVG